MIVFSNPMALRSSSSWPFMAGYANQLDALALVVETRMA